MSPTVRDSILKQTEDVLGAKVEKQLQAQDLSEFATADEYDLETGLSDYTDGEDEVEFIPTMTTVEIEDEDDGVDYKTAGGVREVINPYIFSWKSGLQLTVLIGGGVATALLVGALHLAVYGVCLVPSAVFAMVWYCNRSHIPLNSVIHNYTAGLVVSFLFSAVLEMSLVLFFYFMLYGSPELPMLRSALQQETTAFTSYSPIDALVALQDPSQSKFWAFSLLTAVFVFGFTEELAKYCLIQSPFKWSSESKQDTKRMIITAVCVGVGFTTAQATTFSGLVGDFWQAMATSGMLLVLNFPMHIITSYYTGVMLVETHIHKKRFQWYHYIAKPVLIRGLYQFTLFAVLSFNFSIAITNVIRGIVALVSVTAAALWLHGQKGTVLRDGGFQRIDPLDMEEKWEPV